MTPASHRRLLRCYDAPFQRCPGLAIALCLLAGALFLTSALITLEAL